MSTDGKKVIYSMIGVSKYYDRRPVLKDISLSYFYGAKIGVLGLNGSGKSSLLRIMAGDDTQYNGETILSDGYTVGFLPQEPLVNEDRTVREVVAEGAGEATALMDEFNRITEQLAEPLSDDEMDRLITRQGEVQEKLDALDAWDLDARLEMAMEALRCPPGEMSVSVVSGGEKRRVALCRLLLQAPDILLLDEPTNHLDAESVAWLEQHLQRYPGTVIAVTHDRYFLDNVAGWILELDRGHGIPWKGNYSSWLDQKRIRLESEEKQESQRRKTLQRELEWIRMTPKGRHAKSKARISAYENLLNQEREDLARDLEIYIPPGPRLGDEVIRAEGVSKGYGDRLLVEDMSFALPPGGMVGVVGPNGAGKTTLFRMITGQETPDNGEIRVGGTVRLAYVDQSRDDLRPEVIAALVHVGEPDGPTHPDLPVVRGFLAGDHPEQGGLPGAIGADNPDHPAGGKGKAHILDQEPVAVALAHPFGPDHLVPEPGSRRDVDFQVPGQVLPFLVEEILIGADPGLGFGVTPLGGHPNPFQLPLEGLPSLAFLLFLRLQPNPLLVQPRRVVALPGNPVSPVQFENPAGHVVEKISVMGHRDDRPRIPLEVLLEPGH